MRPGDHRSNARRRSLDGAIVRRPVASRSDGEAGTRVDRDRDRDAGVALPDQWQLTERQRDIVERLLRGASTKEIAHALFISVPTVETHLGHIYDTLGVSGRRELLACYFQTVIRPHIE